MSELKYKGVTGIAYNGEEAFTLDIEAGRNVSSNRGRGRLNAVPLINMFIDLSSVPANAGSILIKVRPYKSTTFRTYRTIDAQGTELDTEVKAIGIEEVKVVGALDAADSAITIDAHLMYEDD